MLPTRPMYVHLKEDEEEANNNNNSLLSRQRMMAIRDDTKDLSHTKLFCPVRSINSI